MRRLFWVGVGAVGAVVVAGRARAALRRYTPEGVAEQVEAAGRRAGSALELAVQQFRTAMDTRERELVTSLLVQPEGGDPGAVLGRGRRRDDGDPGATPATGARTVPGGRVDDDDSLYDF